MYDSVILYVRLNLKGYKFTNGFIVFFLATGKRWQLPWRSQIVRYSDFSVGVGRFTRDPNFGFNRQPVTN